MLYTAGCSIKVLFIFNILFIRKALFFLGAVFLLGIIFLLSCFIKLKGVLTQIDMEYSELKKQLVSLSEIGS